MAAADQEISDLISFSDDGVMLTEYMAQPFGKELCPGIIVPREGGGLNAKDACKRTLSFFQRHPQP